jgi:MarR family transcriptional regulator, organic hydroperoxide resistance regulator
MYGIDVTDVEAHGNPGYLIWRLSMRWRAAVDRAVAPLGLTHAQYSMLASLSGLSRGGGRPSQRELADFTGLDPIYVSKLARALERSGFVTRATHTADPRAVQLALTERGTEVVREAIGVVHALQDRLTEPLGGSRGADTRELVGLLLRLLNHPTPEGDVR